MSNHIGVTNKKADTPCTDERVVYIDGNPWVNAPFARSLERELNAAEDRIKRLEEAGDALCITMQRESKYLHGENFKASINVWIKAKEVKP